MEFNRKLIEFIRNLMKINKIQLKVIEITRKLKIE